MNDARKPTARRIEKWIWILVYAGLAVGGVGLAVRPGDASLGWGLASLGAVLVVSGATLVWLRSRMKIDET